MKTKLLISIMLFVTIAAFVFKTPIEKENKSNLTFPVPITTDKEFLITAMNSGKDTGYQYYPQLGANAWHSYVSPTFGWYGVPNDRYDVPGSVYGGDLVDKINLHRNTYGFRSIMDRPKTVYLLYGQRSEYQCEDSSHADPDYWFYTYRTHEAGTDTNDHDFNGNGAKVRYCQSNPDNPGSNAGYVVKDLRANREQANKKWPPTVADYYYKWYVMPRIRIDTSVVRLYPDLKVCSIYMLDWNGDKIDSVDILAKYFKVQNGQYNGNYIEEYDFPNNINKLVIDTPKICPGYAKDFANWSSTDSIKTDFRVYWYGLCDMWIDYVRVENLPAHDLFKQNNIWDNQIKEETDFALTGYASSGIPNNFYMEEFEFNTVPCIKYVDSIITSHSGGKITLMTNLNYPLFKIHVPHAENYEFSPADMEKYLINKANIKYLVNTSYPLQGSDSGDSKSYHPNTLSNADYDKNSGILSHKISASAYDDSLQRILDSRIGFSGGSGFGFIQILRKTDSISKAVPDLNLIHLEQAHLIWTPGHKLKEPSNEEMKLMANLSITYGAKGIMYFAYDSENDFSNTQSYQRGLTEVNLTPRNSSVYGQNKWEGVQKIDSTLNKWGPYLMSFDNTNRKSYINRLQSERSLMSANTFIKKLDAFPAFEFAPDPIPDLSNSTAEPNNSAYLQAAFFQKEYETEQNKYFMIVNRRCSPFIDYTSANKIGGRRLVTMKINPSYLPGFANWKIYNLATGDTSFTFSKYDSVNFVFVGDFLPGEGKLYKLAPVMQEGGTLVADEEVSNIQFVCKDEVNNNGKNVRLSGGTSIQFKEDAGINITGGNFVCSNSTLTGIDSSQWNGIFLSNTGIDSIVNSTFTGAKSSVIILNDTGYFFTSRVIINNVFNVPTGSGNNGIYGENNFRITIQDNTFNMPYNPADRHIGVYLKNNNTTGVENLPEENEPAPNYRMFLIHNTFNNGTVSAMLMNYTSSYLPFYVKSNTLNSSCAYGIVGRNMTGSIKDNIISYTGALIPMGICLSASSPDLYNNTINTENVSIHTISSSYPNLAPIVSGSGLSWTGGKNRLISLNSDNIQIGAAGNAYTNLGENRFTIQDTSENRYHIFGWVDTSMHKYFSMNNCWYLEGNARIYLRRNNTQLPHN